MVEKLKNQVIKSQKPNDFASLATDYDEFKPHQKLISDEDRIENFRRVREMKDFMQFELIESTLVETSKKRVSLFGVAVN